MKILQKHYNILALEKPENSANFDSIPVKGRVNLHWGVGEDHSILTNKFFQQLCAQGIVRVERVHSDRE